MIKLLFKSSRELIDALNETQKKGRVPIHDFEHKNEQGITSWETLFKENIYRYKEDTQCLLWRASSRKEYGMISNPKGLTNVDTNSQMAAHRIIWSVFYQMPIPRLNEQGWVLMHQCNNSECIQPDHIEVGTHDKNMRHRRYHSEGWDMHPTKS
jgi:hypothetical protein